MITTKNIFELAPEKINVLAWDSPVRTQELVTPLGYGSEIYGVIASLQDGTETVLGSYKHAETLLTNEEMISKVRQALTNMGSQWTEEITMLKGGSRMRAVFTVTNYDLGNVGHSPALPQIVAQNSYDGSWKPTLGFAVKLLVCLNGMYGTTIDSVLQQKHSPNLSLATVEQKLALSFENGVKGVASLGGLSDIPIDGDDGALRVFSNIVKASKGVRGGGVSKRQAAHMLNYYVAPDENEIKLPHTFWRAYMAGTRAMRDLETMRPTQAHKANEALGQVFRLAMSGTGSYGGKVVVDQLLAIPTESLTD